MLRLTAAIALLLLAAVAAAMLWQHRRYLHARRDPVQDRQPLFHSSRVFHVVAFLELARGRELFESVRALRDDLEALESVRMVYAGKVALNGQSSRQLARSFGEEVQWDAIVCVQFPSREAWDRFAASGELKRALAAFERSYVHGMKRSALANLMIPQALLARRLWQIATRAPARHPFEPASQEQWELPVEAPAFERLSAERELGRNAAVVVNLVLPGTPEQRRADRAYVERMFGLMAEMGNGPMHMGRAVTLERDTDFRHVAIVYYPGVDYFRSMAESRFFQGIIGGKQLGDTQASITVPILGRL